MKRIKCPVCESKVDKLVIEQNREMCEECARFVRISGTKLTECNERKGSAYEISD